MIAAAAVEEDIFLRLDAVKKYRRGAAVTSNGFQPSGMIAGSRKLKQESEAAARLLAAIVRGDSVTFDALVNQVNLNFEVRFEDIYITPLIAAVISDRTEFIGPLIQAGADPDLTNSEDLTALDIATIRDNAEAIQALAAGGADLSKNNPLFRAASFGDLNALRALIAAGANPNQEENQMTPLQMAAYLGNSEVISILLENGADSGVAFQGNASPADLVCGCVVADSDVVRKRCNFGGCGSPATIRALFD